MGASTSSEQSVPIEQREAENLAASTGALSTLQKCFSILADPHSGAIPSDSLQQCFRLSYENPVTGATAIPDSFPAVLDHLGPCIADLFFVSEKGGVSWIELVRGYNRCCARKPLSMSVTTLLRVFTATVKKAGLNCNLEFETGDDDCKITGWLMPVDVVMLLWMCWGMNWFSKEGRNLCVPDVKHIVLSAIESCAEGDSGVNVWEWEFSGEEVQLPVGKFLTWVLKTVPSLPGCFSEFVYAVLKHSASQEPGVECLTSSAAGTSSAADTSSTVECSSTLLSPGIAWAISLTLTGPLGEEISRACFPTDANEINNDLLYRSHLHGRGLNRFWSNVQGYQGPLLVLIAATSEDGSANKRNWIIGALTHQGFENRDLFYGSSGCLYALSPVFHAYPPAGKERNFVYSHLHPTGKVYEAKPKPVGIGFGGSMGNERIYVDEDFSKVTIRHHAADKTYQSGSLFPEQGFLPVDALITEVEIWGLGGRGAKDVQDSYKDREQLFTEQRRKVDLKTFANWEDSPEKMLMDMISNPNAIRREDR
ncbi:uncharacterized protein LOC126783146 [Argentina anserina]|uniref:uncharacterized protein LOC126783146 n=1 Tax=Argentina anserina TaxID=57926 RepID=UPI0021766476|nr:uncharacterized protein LOC126783146 [Potentilla anserina]